MTKRIKIDRVICSCEDCIYVNYSPDYNISYDSGYDCGKTGKRIVDDWNICNSNNPNPTGWPKIPDWCPLPDEEE